MKYKEVYLALNQRKLDAPGFHYSDYSGWRAANQSYMTRQRPLWIVAEDPVAGRRMWICHDGSALSVTICKMNSEGHILYACMTPFSTKKQESFYLQRYHRKIRGVE